MNNLSSIFSRLTGQMIALIVLVVTILVAVLWYTSFYQPVLDEQAALRTEIADLDQKIQVGNRAKANVPQLCGVVADLQVQRREFLSALPSSEKYADLIRTFKLQIGNNRGQINSLTRAAGAASGALPAGVRAVSTNLNMTGTFGSMIGILQSLEGQQRFLRLDGLNLNLDGGNNNSNQASNQVDPKLTAAVSVIAYVYNAAQGTVDRPLNPLCQVAPTTTTPPEGQR
jgi:type IV pilus assembly protein PilO